MCEVCTEISSNRKKHLRDFPGKAAHVKPAICVGR